MSNSNTNPTSPGPGVSRRTLVAGAAWSAPVMALAAASPFASASAPCPEQAQINWASSFTATDRQNGQGTFTTPTGETVTYTLVVVSGPNNEVPATSTNLTTNSIGVFLGDRQTVAAPSKDFDAAYTQTTTVTFDRPVTNLSFRIFDVDGSEFYREHVRVLGLPGATATPGIAVELDPASNTFRPVTDANIGETSGSGAVNYTSTGQTTSFVVEVTTPRTAVPRVTTDVSHGVRLSNLTYSTGCPVL